MTKLTRFLIVAAILGSMGGGAFAAWHFRGRITGGPPPEPTAYEKFVTRVGAPESVVRDELNFLASTATSPLSADDRKKASALTRECLDAKSLLAIDHVRTFVAGDTSPYHFVSDAHRDKLRAIAGDNPSTERVLSVRTALAKLGDEFGLIRQPPDWKINIEGEAPPMPFLDLLRSGPLFRSAGAHPMLVAEPHIPAFAAADGELLVQLQEFFNTRQARAAFPPAKFAKLYKNGQIPPIPSNLTDYKKEIEEAVGAEKVVLLPGEKPDPEGVEAVNDVYAKLERFLTAVVQIQAN